MDPGRRCVGTGTLAFSQCDRGTLDYTFTDGSGLTGTIDLTRLLPNVTCRVGTAPPTNADYALSGNWYDPATDGQGFLIDVNPLTPFFFLTWYTYAPTGQGAGAASQRWFTAQVAYVAGSRTVTATLYETTGGLFDRVTNPAPLDGGGRDRDGDVPELLVGANPVQLHERSQCRDVGNHQPVPHRARPARVRVRMSSVDARIASGVAIRVSDGRRNAG